MPNPVEDNIVPPPTTPIEIGLEPAQNGLISLHSLLLSEKYSGLPDWVTNTASALTSEEWDDHKLVFIGLYYTLVPQESWPSFSAYVESLENADPVTLRDRMLNKYAQFPPKDGEKTKSPTADAPPVDWDHVLQDADTYLAVLTERFGADHVDSEIETRAYSYVIDPPAMQTLIVSHLRHMWDKHLGNEWERVEPMLLDAVKAFQQVDFSSMSKMEAAQLIVESIADEKEEWLQKRLGECQQVTFVPSAHVGPYVLTVDSGDDLWVMFGARPPVGITIDAPDLSRADIVTQLNALADDTRLRILKLISDQGELRSQEVMEALDLSQSAASRHLKQLSATGYLRARRCNGAKCFRFNSQRVSDTLQSLSNFFLLGE